MNIVDYVGIPYSIPETDCWGIVRMFARNELGKTYPQYMYSDLNNEAMAESVIKLVDTLGIAWLKVENDLKLGDVLIFRIMGHETHCGVYIGNGDFLHTLKGRMSCIENLGDSNWKQRHTRSYRWLGN